MYTAYVMDLEFMNQLQNIPYSVKVYLVVTYIPDYRDLFRKDEQEQVCIARLIKDNIERLPL